MKKILITLLLLAPTLSFAAFAAPWQGTSTSQGWIFPGRVNGLEQTVVGSRFIATSTSLSSKFHGVEVSERVTFDNDPGGFNDSYIQRTNSGMQFWGGGALNFELDGSGNATLYESLQAAFDGSLYMGTPFSRWFEIWAKGQVNAGQLAAGTTSPYAKLSVHANPNDDTFFDTLFAVGSSTASATTSLFTVKNNGNVGIGKSNPTQKLDVAGGITATGLITSSAGNISAPTGNVSALAGVFSNFPTAALSVSGGAPDDGGGPYYSASFTNGSYTTYTDWDDSVACTLICASAQLYVANANEPGYSIYAPGSVSYFGSIGLGSALSFGSGGTGATSYGANRIVTVNSSNNAFTSNANFNYTNNKIGIGTTSPFSALSVGTTTASNGTLPLFTVASSTHQTLFTVLSKGYVGVGTENPLTTLHVVGNSAAGLCCVRMQNTSSVNAGVNFSLVGDYSQFDNTNGLFMISNGDTVSPIIFRTNQYTEQMRLTSAGNLGLGTSSPYAKLSVVGETVARNFTATSTTATSTFMGVLSVGSTTPSQAAWFSVGSTSPSIFVNKANGMVGINGYPSDTNPFGRTPLSVSYSAGGNSSTNLPLLKLENPGGGQSGFTFSFSGTDQSQVRADSVGSFIFASKGKQYFAYTNDYSVATDIQFGSFSSPWMVGNGTTGNLGLGTTSPYAKLSVVGEVVARNFHATSTTATTTIAGPLRLSSTGTNPTQGNATLVAGTVTVTTGAATSNSFVHLTRKTSGGTIGTEITYTITNGSFTITSDSASDTSVFTWLITQ